MASVKVGFGKYVWIIGIVALFGSGGLFAYLESLGLNVECEDKVCEVNELCLISCNVTNPTSQSVYLFNHDDWKVIFSPDVVDADIYVKYYGKWRYTNFTRETRFGNIPDERLYVFVFTRYSKKYFQLRINVSEPSRIKWDFGILDPVIVSYEYLYKNLNREVPIYEEKLVLNPVSINDSWSEGDDYTIRELIGYKTEYYLEKIPNAVNVAGIEYYNANVNEAEGYLYVCNVPVGDRNWEEYPMRQYEIDKGICKKIDLLK